MSSFVSLPILSKNLIHYFSGSIRIPRTELNLKQTILGGQSFRWFEQTSNEFIGVLDRYIINLKHENDNLEYRFYTNISNENLSTNREEETNSILSNYFQLSIKLNDLFEQWSKSDQRFATKTIPLGIRVLAQDPLENLLSFICSSNNNVQRITKMIKSLCEEYGREIGQFNEITYHQFPTLDELDRTNLEQRLRELGFGYRARYIHQAVRYLKYTINDPKFFDQLKSASTEDARTQLLKIMGVGRKVADCVLLMSLDKQNIVPVDTHIHSIAVTYYGQNRKVQLTTKNYDEISSFFQQLWQPFAGWAQAAAFSNELRWPTDTQTIKRSKSKQEILTIKKKSSVYIDE